jgi:hypothetical protein
MVGPLKIAPSGFTHLLVAVDKFTKWVEAKPIRKFVKDIVVRFGIPHSIITDNGTNLSQGEVEEYCHSQWNPPRLGICGTSTVQWPS